MRAVVVSEFFGSDLELIDRDVPEPGEGEVRVRVHAASVNGFDLAAAAGYLKDFFECRFPLGVGKDFSGEVDAVGPGVTDYAVGDRVFGVVTKPFLGDGSFAEYVTVPTSVGVAKLPDSLSYREGAAIGLAGAAGQAAADAAEFASGQTVLVVGATGGVGNVVVELAAAAGARVIATAHSEAEQQLVTSLGAGATVDYTGDLAAQVREAAPDGVDAVVHLAGDFSSLELVRDGGRFVSTLMMTPDAVQSDSVVVVPIYADPTPAMLDRIAASQSAGETSVTVQDVFSLEHASEAMARFGQGTLGKVVISLD